LCKSPQECGKIAQIQHLLKFHSLTATRKIGAREKVNFMSIGEY
jgi:hypothetical protein